MNTPTAPKKNQRRHFWIVEDDPEVSETIQGLVKDRYRDAEITSLYSESSFRRQMNQSTSVLPDMVIGDAMLPWMYRGELEVEARPVDTKGTDAFRLAGVRNWQYFRDREKERNVPRLTPWIYYTILTEEDIDFPKCCDENTRYVAKDSPLIDLQATIVESLEVDAEWDDSEEVETKRLSADEKIRRTLLEGLRTDLKDCLVFAPQ